MLLLADGGCLRVQLELRYMRDGDQALRIRRVAAAW
jgi:hypothetical protein